jgi:hypothetical protein
VLSVSETLLIVIGSLRYFLNSSLNLWLSHGSKFFCKSFLASIYFLSQLSSWILVIISIDRFLSIKFPYKYSITRNNKVCCVTLSIVFVVLSILNLPNLIFPNLFNVTNENKNSTSQMCMIDSSSNYNHFVLNILDLFMATLIPFTLMLITTILIYMSIIKNSKQKMFRTKQIMCNRKYRFISTILVRNFFFLIFNLPICFLVIYNSYYDSIGQVFNDQEKLQLYKWLAHILANMFNYMNYSFSFFVHFAFNCLFRRIFMNIFIVRKKILPSKSTIITR